MCHVDVFPRQDPYLAPTYNHVHGNLTHLSQSIITRGYQFLFVRVRQIDTAPVIGFGSGHSLAGIIDLVFMLTCLFEGWRQEI